jgi:hypothetical protein
MDICLLTQDSWLGESISRFVELCCSGKVRMIGYRAPENLTDLLQTVDVVSRSLYSSDGDEVASRHTAPLVLVDPCFLSAPGKMWENSVADSMARLDPLYVPTTRPDGSGEIFNPEPGQLFGLMVLAHPEVHWAFLFQPSDLPRENAIDLFRYTTQDQSQAKTVDTLKAKTLKEVIELLACRYHPLFDPSGLRRSIKAIVREKHHHPVRIRDRVAAAIDEEEPYAFLHGYLAYKLGYRVHLVMTERMMTQLFGETQGGTPADLTFQDIFLNFPDHAGRGPQSNLPERFREDREGKYPLLAKINTHIFVSVGHRHSASYEANRAFFRDQHALGKKIKKVFKPSGGMYNLLKDAGLLNRYWKNLKEWIKRTAPPKEPEPEGGTHSAPGRLVVIAERLNNRAEKILQEAQTVQECILGATLALEASELLGYRTPTTALEAIALRHQLEVKAECMFYGVGYTIDVKSRLKEIEMEVKAVARWFHGSVKKRSLLNAQLSIITEIARIFREHGQFDEEQICLQRLRDLNRRWYFLTHPWFIPFWPLRWYVEKLVGSLPAFVMMVLAWPFVFGALSNLMEAGFKNSADWKFWDHIAHAYFTFFGLQPPEFPAEWKAGLLTVLIVLAGFLHLGIFIAHLYTLIMRR